MKSMMISVDSHMMTADRATFFLFPSFASNYTRGDVINTHITPKSSASLVYLIWGPRGVPDNKDEGNDGCIKLKKLENKYIYQVYIIEIYLSDGHFRALHGESVCALVAFEAFMASYVIPNNINWLLVFFAANRSLQLEQLVFVLDGGAFGCLPPAQLPVGHPLIHALNHEVGVSVNEQFVDAGSASHFNGLNGGENFGDIIRRSLVGANRLGYVAGVVVIKPNADPGPCSPVAVVRARAVRVDVDKTVVINEEAAVVLMSRDSHTGRLHW